jgi:tetratricopeptide (TPR) repeat protein
VDGDNEEALRAIRRAAELAPGSKAVFNRAWIAIRVNRPQEAIEALLSLDPERGPMRGWPGYWENLRQVLYMLGEHEEALEASRRACELCADAEVAEWFCLYYPTTSLAASGHVEEAIAMFTELDASSVGFAEQTAQCLLGYGHVDAARQLAIRVISWLEDRPDEETRTADHRQVYGWTLFNYGRVEEARTVFDSLVGEDADNVYYRGTRGFFAATAGDSAQARRDAEWLTSLNRPYLRGSNTFRRAAIAGALGEREDAVRLLRQAFSEGAPYGWNLTWFAEFAPLRDYPPFQQLMRPKG